MPVLDNPIWIVSGPFRHFELAVHHALVRRDAFGFEIEVNVSAAGRLVYHADGKNKLYHQVSPGKW